MANKKEYAIDFVIPWVDDSDPEWIKSRMKYADEVGLKSVVDNSAVRYRDWDTLKYLFRSIDKYAPWVRKVHLITCGHLPKWLNSEAPNLNVVRHEDYMDADYLPTFSSHAIELNMHKIKGLAEHFVYFNDDILLLQPTKRDDFFRRGLPRDYAVLSPLTSSHKFSVMDTALTDIEIINAHFKKNEVIRKNPWKWFNPIYGADAIKTILLMPWPLFPHIYGKHLCNSFLKSTFYEVWMKEHDLLDSTCRHKFRTRRDVNQWVFREWQICKGSFIPVSPKRGKPYYIKNDNSDIVEALKQHKHKIICINDNGAVEITDFEKSYQELVRTMEMVFPEKSIYEK